MIRRLHVPVLEAKDVVRHLAKQEAHWRLGYSVQELATAWVNAGNSFPRNIRDVLKTAPEYESAELIDDFFEREVELGTPGRNSQTDLMVVVGLRGELGIAAIEGKVEESFAELVSEWNTTSGKPGDRSPSLEVEAAQAPILQSCRSCVAKTSKHRGQTWAGAQGR